MLKRLLSISILLLGILIQPAYAKISESELEKLSAIMINVCSLGYKIDIIMEADGKISFIPEKSIKGTFKASKSEIPSVIEFLLKNKSEIADKQITETRECMKKYLDQIFAAIIGGNSNSESQISIDGFQIIDGMHTEKDGDNVVLSELKQRSNVVYNISKAKDLKIAFAFLVDGFKMIEKSINISITASILSFKGDTLAETHVWTYTHINEWEKRPIVERIGKEKVVNFFKSYKEKINLNQAFPVIVLLENFETKELPKGKATLKIKIEDIHSGAIKTMVQPLEIYLKSRK